MNNIYGIVTNHSSAPRPSTRFAPSGRTAFGISRNQAYHSIGYAAFISLISKLKISFIIGSKMAFFGASHCISPLIGYYSGATTTFLTFFMRTIIFALMSTSLPITSLFYHIPTLCASLYFATYTSTNNILRNRLAMATIPILCFMLFYLHPIGNQALAYTFFWLIPLLSLLITHKNIFIHALASTFIAHAVGSVIWIYTIGPKTAAAWLALIPIVIIERVLFASGMVLCIQLVAALKKHPVAFHTFWKNLVQSMTTNTIVTNK